MAACSRPSETVKKAVQFWDPKSGKAIRTGPAHAEQMARFAFSPDSRWMASVDVGPDQQSKLKDAVLVKVWNVEDGRERFTLRPGEEVLSVAYSPDGKLLAAGGGTWQAYVGVFQNAVSGRIRLWHAETGREIRSFVAHSGNIWTLAFSPDGKRLASAAADRTVKVWDVATGTELLTLAGHTTDVSMVQFSRDGTRLGSSSVNYSSLYGEAILWDTVSGQPLLVFDECFGTFSPDGRRLVTTRRRAASLWHLTRFTEEHLHQREAVHLLQFYRDKFWLKDEILQAIRRDATVSEPVRRRALALAEGYRELPSRLNEESWKVAAKTGAAADAYRLALRQAEAASRVEPKNVNYLITLAAAPTVPATRPRRCKRDSGECPAPRPDGSSRLSGDGPEKARPERMSVHPGPLARPHETAGDVPGSPEADPRRGGARSSLASRPRFSTPAPGTSSARSPMTTRMRASIPSIRPKRPWTCVRRTPGSPAQSPGSW